MPPDTLEQFPVLIVPAADSITPLSPVFVLDTAADYSFQYTIVAERPALPSAVTEPAWMSGLDPQPRAVVPASHSGFILVFAVILITVLFSFNSLKSMLSFNLDELVNVRKGRDNVFDERPAGIALLQGMLTMVFIVCGGFLLAGGIIGKNGNLSLLDSRAMLIAFGMVLAYYLFQVGAYSAVGFTFTTDEGRREWVRGFNASISLLAMSLIVPALVAVFYPDAMVTMAVLALIIFVLAKFVFILKGFRIFFDNLFSLLYFILYLCTLEIIPLIFVYNCSADLLI